MLLQATSSCAKQAVDYNGTPLTTNGSLIITPNSSPATLNSYLTTSNTAGLQNNGFGSQGTVTTNIIPQTPIASDDTVYSILLQPDGKIITVSSNKLVRYNTDGTLDPSFGTEGIATINANIEQAHGAALLNTGQILVVNNNNNTTINVYSSAGTYESSLPQPTILNASIGYAALTVQSNGSIVAGGALLDEDTGSSTYFVARWNSNLTIDTDFEDPYGYVTGPGIDSITDLITNSSGTIYATGTDTSPCLYDQDGNPTEFNHPTNAYQQAIMFYGNNNLITASDQNIQFASWAGPDYADANYITSDSIPGSSQALLLQPTKNNAIIIIGNNVNNNFIVARFIGTAGTDYGHLDTTFGNGGSVTGLPMTAYAGAVQSDGKIIVGGNFHGLFDGAVCVIRLNPDGTIDPTFQTPNFLGAVGQPFTAALQSNGTLITAGTDGIQTCFASYTATGTLNTSFGSGFFKSLSGVVTASVLQPDGCLVTASCCGQFCIARYTPAGILDTTFGGGNGFVTGPVGTFSPYALLLQQNGGLVALGTTVPISPSPNRICLVRYSSMGVIDTSFGDGLVTDDNRVAYAGIIQPNGQIIAAGSKIVGDIYIARYNTDGTPDTTFNNETASFTATAGTLYAALAQSNGSLVFVGASDTHFFLLRTNANGVLDTTFGINGFATGPMGTAYAAVLQSDGKIVALGTSATHNGNLTIARFNTNGSLDTSFGSAGTGVITGGLGTFYAALLQENNQILGIGQSGNTGVANFFINNYINPFTLASFTASYGNVGLL